VQPFWIIFITVFLAELGDKTQLATVLFAADREHHPFLVFAVASAALIASTAIAVAFGTLAERFLSMIPVKLIAGLGFIAIGVWTVTEHVRGT
jgi:putative Ca2+/H+ antiporter (TMEM165/GDT1 family)